MGRYKIVMEFGSDKSEFSIEADSFRDCAVLAETAVEVANQLRKQTGKPVGRLLAIEYTEVSNGTAN